MEKRSIRTERSNINQEIEISNQKLCQLKAQIVKLQNWLKEEVANNEPPTLADVIEGILTRQQQAGKATIHNLETATQCLNFLTENGIKDIAGLDRKFKPMIGEQKDIWEDLKSIERRLPTLNNHSSICNNCPFKITIKLK